MPVYVRVEILSYEEGGLINAESLQEAMSKEPVVFDKGKEVDVGWVSYRGPYKDQKEAHENWWQDRDLPLPDE